MRRSWWAPVALLLVGCPGARDLPPRETETEAPKKKEEAPFCGKVFKDAKGKSGGGAGGGCCVGPVAGILKGADVTAACGATAATYLGERPDGGACRFYFQAAAGGDADAAFVMLSHPVIPAGAPAPVRPDPLLPWKWKKVALRDAIGYQALAAANEPGLLERQTILWAGRGRRIVGLHASKQVCSEPQAQALLQKAIDGVP